MINEKHKVPSRGFRFGVWEFGISLVLSLFGLPDCFGFRALNFGIGSQGVID
jgi:hypothetical protein